MKINRVETYPLLYRLPVPYGDANGYKKYRSTFVIRIVTESGIDGWGECADWLPALKIGFEQRIIPYLTGRDAHLRNEIVGRVAEWHRRAAAAVSMALVEIAAKSAGIHVCELWGGRLRSEVPVYASFQSYLPEENWQRKSLENVTRAADRGFRQAKVKIGGKPLAEDQRHIRLLQHELGGVMAFMLDANQSYDAATVKKWLPLFGQWQNTVWLEEPLPFRLAGEYAALRGALPVPLAGGENLAGADSMMPLLENRALDIVQPDPAHHAGLDAYRESLNVARLFGFRVSPHCYDGGIARMYAIFAQACLPPWSKIKPEQIEPVEWDFMDNPLAGIMPLSVTNGTVTLPSGPGTGAEPDLELIRAYLWDGSCY
mgnify:CR=1 FL=1